MNTFIFCGILLELIMVAWLDVKTKKISNYWPLLNILLSLSVHSFFPVLYPVTWETLIFPIGWILIGFFLFLLKIMGAGDSKYLASLFLLVPLELHMVFLEKIILGTLLVGLILLSSKILRNFTKLKAYTFSSYWVGIKDTIRSHFSYAPVILLGWILLGVDQW